MISFEIEVRIQKPVVEVFAFVADLENLPKWNYFVTQVNKTSQGSVGLGSTYHQERKTDSQELRITRYEEDKELVVETIPPSRPETVRSMSFQEEETGTRIIDRWKLDTGHPRLLQKLAAGRVKSAVTENLGKLKKLLETGEVTLQDGRREKYSRSTPTMKRYYAEGLFISTYQPEIAIRLPASLDYIGSTSFILVEAAQIERHHFVDTNPDGSIRCLVILHFESYLPAIDQTFNYRIPEPADQAGPDFRFSPSKVHLGEHDYIHNTWFFDAEEHLRQYPDRELAHTRALLAEHGYELPGELQMSRYVRAVGADRKSELILFYIEPLVSTGLQARDFIEGGRGEHVIDQHSSELTARSLEVFVVERG